MVDEMVVTHPVDLAREWIKDWDGKDIKQHLSFINSVKVYIQQGKATSFDFVKMYAIGRAYVNRVLELGDTVPGVNLEKRAKLIDALERATDVFNANEVATKLSRLGKKKVAIAGAGGAALGLLIGKSEYARERKRALESKSGQTRRRKVTRTTSRKPVRKSVKRTAARSTGRGRKRRRV